MLGIALLGPAAIMYSDYGFSTSYQIVAVLWQVYSYFDPYSPVPAPQIYFEPLLIVGTLPLLFLRYIFVYLMYRLYTGKTTRKRTLLCGIAAELQIPAFYYILTLPSLLFYPPGYGFYFPLIIPTPLLFISGYLIIRIRPPATDASWIEEEPKSQWWGSSETSQQPESPMQSVESTPKPSDTDAVKKDEDDWLVDDR